jgi:hypothetical protein
MPDQPLSDDELLSSHLDGELSDHARRRLDDRLATDAALRDRLTALEAARALSATPVAPLGAVDTDRLIATALAASTAAGASAGNVTDLAAATTRRRAWPARAATVAAGVLLLALAVPALRAIDTSDDDDAGDASADMADTTTDDGGADGDDSAGDMGDMALESALEPLDSDGPAAADEMFGALDDADTADTVEAGEFGEVNETDGLAYSTDQVRLFVSMADFDPLADDLGAFADDDGLVLEVNEQAATYTPDEVATTTTVPPPDDSTDIARDELLDVAARRLEGVLTGDCPDVADIVIDFFGDSPTEVLAADYAVATSDGDPVVVGLFSLSESRVVTLVIDLTTCELRSISDVDGG